MTLSAVGGGGGARLGAMKGTRKKEEKKEDEKQEERERVRVSHFLFFSKGVTLAELKAVARTTPLKSEDKEIKKNVLDMTISEANASRALDFGAGEDFFFFPFFFLIF